MKTQNLDNKLKFEKNSLNELNQNTMVILIGGTIVGIDLPPYVIDPIEPSDLIPS